MEAQGSKCTGTAPDSFFTQIGGEAAFVAAEGSSNSSLSSMFSDNESPSGEKGPASFDAALTPTSNSSKGSSDGIMSSDSDSPQDEEGADMCNPLFMPSYDNSLGSLSSNSMSSNSMSGHNDKELTLTTPHSEGKDGLMLTACSPQDDISRGAVSCRFDYGEGEVEGGLLDLDTTWESIVSRCEDLEKEDLRISEIDLTHADDPTSMHYDFVIQGKTQQEPLHCTPVVPVLSTACTRKGQRLYAPLVPDLSTLHKRQEQGPFSPGVPNWTAPDKRRHSFQLSALQAPYPAPTKGQRRLSETNERADILLPNFPVMSDAEVEQHMRAAIHHGTQCASGTLPVCEAVPAYPELLPRRPRPSLKPLVLPNQGSPAHSSSPRIHSPTRLPSPAPLLAALKPVTVPAPGRSLTLLGETKVVDQTDKSHVRLAGYLASAAKLRQQL